MLAAVGNGDADIVRLLIDIGVDLTLMPKEVRNLVHVVEFVFLIQFLIDKHVFYVFPALFPGDNHTR